MGDAITFGHYEQDNNTANGAEPIEWQVLAREGNRILVISRYALDCQPYNNSFMNVTWESCTLRSWLNGRFLRAAFTSEEQAVIPTVTVNADRNPDYSTSPGNSTTDRVFLLSITEAKQYFISDEARKCAPTAYAIAHGAYVSSTYKVDGNGTCLWWLRSPGHNSYHAPNVDIDGSVLTHGFLVNYDNYGVRPALWIDLES